LLCNQNRRYTPPHTATPTGIQHMSPGHAPLVIYPGAQILGPSLIIHSHPENSTGRDELHAPNMELCHRGSGVINKGHSFIHSCYTCSRSCIHSCYTCSRRDMTCQPHVTTVRLTSSIATPYMTCSARTAAPSGIACLFLPGRRQHTY
jgi:hypothetical protein